MKKDLVNINFLLEIQKKVPNKSELVNILLDLLQIEKEAVYRRLRGDVPFSFKEVTAICLRFGISIDQLMGIKDKTTPFILQMNDYESPIDSDFSMWENYSDVLELFLSREDLTFYETWTTIPLPFCYRYPALTRFYIFKWCFQVKNYTPIKSYDQIQLNEHFVQHGARHLSLYSQASQIQLILADTLFTHLVKDILFFHTIRLINEQNIKDIYRELVICLNDLEQIASQGDFDGFGNKISLFISEVKIDTEYSLVKAGDNYIGLLRTFVMNAATTNDVTTFQYMENWFNSLKRLATLISVSGEKERIKYFIEQREIIKGLENI